MQLKNCSAPPLGPVSPPTCTRRGTLTTPRVRRPVGLNRGRRPAATIAPRKAAFAPRSGANHRPRVPRLAPPTRQVSDPDSATACGDAPNAHRQHTALRPENALRPSPGDDPSRDSENSWRIRIPHAGGHRFSRVWSASPRSSTRVEPSGGPGVDPRRARARQPDSEANRPLGGGRQRGGRACSRPGVNPAAAGEPRGQPAAPGPTLPAPPTPIDTDTRPTSTTRPTPAPQGRFLFSGS
jgi:hypothetical protein